MKKPRIAAPTPARRRTKIDVDPARLAMAAIERLRGAVHRLGLSPHIDEGADAAELNAREAVLGRAAPPSYAAVLRAVREIGPPDELFDAVTMTVHAAELRKLTAGARYVPFARERHDGSGRLICFDLRGDHPKHPGELAVVSWIKGSGSVGGVTVHRVARNFAEWLDALADARSAEVSALRNVPPRLQRILLELGFSFPPPGLYAELETADPSAIDALVGDAVVDALLADGERYDHTGKAAIALRLDDCSASVRLRDGAIAVPAEQVFAWLRGFADEDFFADDVEREDLEDQLTVAKVQSHTRDLRVAPRRVARDEASGERTLLTLGARAHVWLDASGGSEAGLVVLGRRAEQGDRRSLLLQLEGTRVVGARYVDEPLSRVHVADDGAIWALGASWAYRFYGFEQDRFALVRPSDGPTQWVGIGGVGTRVLVWGAGALLAFDGRAFAPFAPDLALHPSETVGAVHYDGDRMTVLVARADFGAVASFDGERWLPIREDHLMQGALHALSSYRGVDWVLADNSVLYTQTTERAPRAYALPAEPARFDDQGRPRSLHEVMPTADSLLLASRGGFLQFLRAGVAVFHRGQDPTREARLIRIDDLRVARPLDPYDRTDADPSSVLGLLGSALWLYDRGHFHPVDLSAY